MRLSSFILHDLDAIMREWDRFAQSLAPGASLSRAALRDDVERMLRFIAHDIESPQTAREEQDKAEGRTPRAAGDTAAHDHGAQRFSEGFSLAEMVSEYRALRASVTRLWLQQRGASTDLMQELIRFNEAIDQVVEESVARFTDKIESDRHLFMAVLGHDLRSPLSAIHMSSQLLMQASNLGNREKQAVVRIAQSGVRMQRMVVDLLEFARMHLAGHVPVNRAACDLHAIARNVIDEIAAAHPQQSVELRVGGDTTGEWDGERLAQLVSNLVGNAVQYGSPGTPVEVVLEGTADVAVLSVTNQGAAIPEDERKRIFEPLRRGTDALDDRLGSLGLGLYIVRQIAVAHGGSVDLVQSDARRTTFTVCLPRSGTATRAQLDVTRCLVERERDLR